DAVYLVLAVAYLLLLRRGRSGGDAPLYFFLVGDALFLTAILALDPRSFAFTDPLLFVVVLRNGLHYGLRTMYLSWSAALVASLLFFVDPSWVDRIELVLTFFVTLALVPVFFASLIERIHALRAIEEERAQLAAINDAIAARSAFLARVSHELRSPLQGIVSALDVLALRQGPRASADDELLQRIRRSSLLLNTHLRDLLTLAKGEAGHLELRPEPFDACALVESVASSALELARAKKLDLVVDVPPEAMFVVADAARIDQILTNLLINSIRYTESGQVRIALRRYRASEHVLDFAVSDTGPGIPEAMLPTLLSPDRTVSASTRRGEGSGIGLAIVRTLVDRLGGKVEVTSRVGRGTTFTIAIPAEPVDAEERDAGHDSPTGRVLVVDGDDDIADALASVVDELGFECDRASSAAIAANLLASRHYDAAVVDVEMPMRGGAELAEETRRAEGPNTHTRFIGMTADDPADAIRAKFDACLRKPIDHASLRHALLGPGTGARPSQPGLWIDG
ncbi:MAG TPA: hybrid sensor histidine kinase/response regulator, partial [Caldimonas sp.]|nr:hybrid sensor histidine kinase/response regulator [Caldimonas sp.]